MKLEVTERV